jgi:hypothetical protein
MWMACDETVEKITLIAYFAVLYNVQDLCSFETATVFFFQFFSV